MERIENKIEKQKQRELRRKKIERIEKRIEKSEFKFGFEPGVLCRVLQNLDSIIILILKSLTS